MRFLLSLAFVVVNMTIVVVLVSDGLLAALYVLGCAILGFWAGVNITRTHSKEK